MGLGTVLANEEIIDGKSERGGFPVERKPLRQWVRGLTNVQCLIFFIEPPPKSVMSLLPWLLPARTSISLYLMSSPRDALVVLPGPVLVLL